MKTRFLSSSPRWLPVAFLGLGAFPARAAIAIAVLHTLLDPFNYDPIDTRTLFTVEGIVTTHVNLTGPSTNLFFYLQDESGGVAVFWRGGALRLLPQAGDRLRITAPLTDYHGLLELAPNVSRPAHQVTRIGSDHPLPPPLPLDLELFANPDPAAIEPLEGRYVVAQDVFLDLTSPTFPSSGRVTITNENGASLPLYVDVRTDIGGRAKPAGPVTVYGVLGQYDTTAPYTSGYELVPTRLADITGGVLAPTVRFTNTLAHLARPGDAATNTFTEQSLRPGERWTLTVSVTDPGADIVNLRPLTAQLPSGARWTLGPVSGPALAATFHFTPTAEQAGQAYTVPLEVWNRQGTNTVTWAVYVPTPTEQQVVITEFLANASSSPTAPHYNPLRRDPPIADYQISYQDEFIELVNLSPATLDLGGWTLADAVQLRHRFGTSFVLEASNAVVVYGGPLAGYPPTIAGLTEPASEGAPGLALNNTGTEIITLRNAAGRLVLRVVYQGSDLASGASLTRYPDADGAFVAHDTVSSHAVSPGGWYDGRRFTEPLVLPTLGPLLIQRRAPGSVELTWASQPGTTHSILAAPAVTGPFRTLAPEISTGQFTDTNLMAVPIRFYRVSRP